MRLLWGSNESDLHLKYCFETLLSLLFLYFNIFCLPPKLAPPLFTRSGGNVHCWTVTQLGWRLQGPSGAANPPAPQLSESRVTSDHTAAAAAAASILTPTPSRASRVLGCLSHMTRVFVPVISTSISVCGTEYHFLFQHWWICSNRVWTTQGNLKSAKMANSHTLARKCYLGGLVYGANRGLT